jgi:uncharacterized protein involved in response to NO
MLDSCNNAKGRNHHIHTTSSENIKPPPVTEEMHKQEPFTRVAPLLKTALLMGVGGGFLLATILTVTYALSIPLGAWWEALAQAHGHLQLYGWAGLFVLGVALHFLPRLRGMPLVGACLVPWLLGILSISLVLRAIGQPVLSLYPTNAWRIGLVSSGVFEVAAYACALSILVLTALSGPRPTTRPAYWSVLPFFAGAFCSLGIASIVNLVNLIQTAHASGLVPSTGDALNVTLGLFGFLVPLALAMSARSLPMYAGLDGFPRQVLWPLAGVYFAGLLLLCVGIDGGPLPSLWAGIIDGLGMVLLGAVVLLFVGIFLSLMRKRGQLPERVAKLAPQPQTLAQTYQKQVKEEQTHYGPFVGLVASAYLWAMLGALLLLIDGCSLLAAGSELVAFDAVRHAFAIGFIALLICGIAPRMLPSFSGSKIVSPSLVSATLWLGNAAAILRVGSILFTPLFVGTRGFAIDTFLFSLSGPCGLALAICLAINLWPTLRSSPRHVV